MLQAPDLMEIHDFRGFLMILEQCIAATTWCTTAAGITDGRDEMFALQKEIIGKNLGAKKNQPKNIVTLTSIGLRTNWIKISLCSQKPYIAP